ncbi:chain length determinant protein [Pontibacter liquoris]|uniref:chain length determinant protein n=1 Tax=Pontibacter liquoris TaxID=2905677 RepID=UPI001FA764A3|nr:chain length determinant protein [Pontibacter liquoris]
MNEENKEVPVTNSERRATADEIDIAAVFNAFFGIFRAIGRGFANFFRLLFLRKELLINFMVLGVALSFGAYYLAKPYYSSSMTLVLADIRNQFVEDQLDKLADMVQDGNIVAISERLNIPAASAKQIKSLEFSNLDEVAEDSILVGSPFKIELALYDKSMFPVMEPALTSYLENNQYFKRQKEIRQRRMQSMINKLKEEIASLDSIKETAATPRGPVNGFVYGEPLDPSNLYKETLSMYQRQVQLEADLDQMDNIQVVIDFSPQTHPTGPNLILYLAIGATVALIAGIIVAISLGEKKTSA